MFTKHLLIKAIYLLTVTFTPAGSHHPIDLKFVLDHGSYACRRWGQQMSDAIVQGHISREALWRCQETFPT